MSRAAIFRASRSPSSAPDAMASITLLWFRSTGTDARKCQAGKKGRSSTLRWLRSSGADSRPWVADGSVSGIISLAMSSDAGAEMTDAATRCPASMPKLTYAANTVPAMVANPPVIRAISSERVIAAT